VTVDVNDIVAAKVEAARRRIAAERAARERRARARAYGLALRHTAHLRHLAAGVSNATPAVSGG
jgi:hypothetical protein